MRPRHSPRHWRDVVGWCHGLARRREPKHIVVMGVSATGKTTVGEGLAEELGCEFIEGDELHPRANIEKMTAGMPLTDEDRWPWLQAIARAGRGQATTRVRRRSSPARPSSAPTAPCCAGAAPTFFVHLTRRSTCWSERMRLRTKHFMPTGLLRSQFDTSRSSGTTSTAPSSTSRRRWTRSSRSPSTPYGCSTRSDRRARSGQRNARIPVTSAPTLSMCISSVPS